MDVKRKKSGFTLVEMLTVLGIIALLLGLLLPALGWVRRIARETKQKAQLTTIGLTLEAFKNPDDYGDYPPSDGYYYPPSPLGPIDYCGAQKLAEALLGRDLLGFNKYSNWSATDLTFYPTDPALLDDSLDDRRGPYLELATTNAFKLGGPEGLFNDPSPLAPDTFVLCDSFGVKSITVGGKTVKAGTPILYYRANTSSKRFEDGLPTADQIYSARDNVILIIVKENADNKDHRLDDFTYFYEKYLIDPKITAIPWPYRPDSYILISAGADGLYGTSDDITNFGN